MHESRAWEAVVRARIHTPRVSLRQARSLGAACTTSPHDHCASKPLSGGVRETQLAPALWSPTPGPPLSLQHGFLRSQADFGTDYMFGTRKTGDLADQRMKQKIGKISILNWFFTFHFHRISQCDV